MGKKKKKRKGNVAIAERENETSVEDTVDTAESTGESDVSDEVSDETDTLGDEYEMDSYEDRRGSAEVTKRDDIDPNPIEVRDDDDYPEDASEEVQAPVMVEQKAAFLITKKQLLKIMSVANLIVWKAAVYSIEGQFVFRACENALTIRATNNSISLKKHVEVFENSGDALFAINAKKLYALVNGLPDGLLRFSIDNLTLQVMSEDRTVKHTLICMAANNFPAEHEKPADAEFSRIPCEIVKKIIDKTHKMVARDTFKPVLRGVYFKRSGEKLTAVSTDGKRLAVTEKYIGGDGKKSLECIIDAEFLKTAYPVILGNYSSTLELAVSGKHTFVNVGGYELMGELVEGTFPNYKQVIPKAHDHEATLNRDEFMSAIKFVTPMISDTQTKKLTLMFSENCVMIKAFNFEHGESERVLPCSYKGEPIEIGFNYTYLLDVLSCIDGDNVCMKFTSDEVPAAFHDTERKDYFFIAMPLKREEEKVVAEDESEEAPVVDTVDATETKAIEAPVENVSQIA